MEAGGVMVEDKREFIIAVDSGGTFTDCVVMDNEGVIYTGKSHSTPQDFSIGVMGSVETVSEKLGLSLKELLLKTRYFFGHGSTVALNTLLTRSGAKSGLITTKGFEDIMIMGRVEQKVAGLSEQERIQVYRLNKAEPIIPRYLIAGVTERIDSLGRQIVPLNITEAQKKIEELITNEVESIAICLLWSFMNPSHEQELKKIIAADYPDILITISSDLTPVMGEYERMTTTAINAYLSPITFRYLSSLYTKLQDAGLEKPLLIMQNVGGMVEVTEARDKGVNLLSSGPVGGVLASKIIGDLTNNKNIITTDVGGTSFDVSLIVDGEITLSPAPIFSQYTIQTPVIDIPSIGAGGGSIAWIEKETGLLKVGPDSAGAFPGPVCYDRGGAEPTFTDANVVLGRIDPEFFLGGRMKLNKEKARRSIDKKIAGPLGIELEEAAFGIIQILTSQMADLVRKTTIDRGYDPSDFVLFSFGGAGPLCCCLFVPLIEGIRKLVIPSSNSVFSAFGMAGSDIVQVERHSEPMAAPFQADRLNKIYEDLDAKVKRSLKRNGVPKKNMFLIRSVDARYWGQVHEISINMPAGRFKQDNMPGFIDQFTQQYENRYGKETSYGEARVEAVTFEIRGIGKLSKPSLIRHEFLSSDSAAALKGKREVYMNNEKGFQDINVFLREKLKPGNTVEGPAIVEANDTTVFIDYFQHIIVDEYLNLVMEL
jgi:N-methylhydantoinase A